MQNKVQQMNESSQKPNQRDEPLDDDDPKS